MTDKTIKFLILCLYFAFIITFMVFTSGCISQRGHNGVNGVDGVNGIDGLMNQTFNLTSNMTIASYTNLSNITVDAGNDIILRLGDNNGINKVSVRNYSNGQVAYIDSLGNMQINQTINATNNKLVLMPKGGTVSINSVNPYAYGSYTLLVNGTQNNRQQLYIDVTGTNAALTPPLIVVAKDSWAAENRIVLNLVNGMAAAAGYGTSITLSGTDAWTPMFKLSSIWDAASTNNAHLIFGIRKSGSIYEAMRVSSSGNITIGSYLINSSQFNVADSVRFAKYGAGSLNTDAFGNLYVISDEDEKTSVRPFSAGLKEVLQITPHTYKFKPESGLDTVNDYVGVIAQELRTVIPDAVYEKGKVTYEQVLKTPEKTDEKTGEITEAEYEQIEKPVLDKDGKQVTELSVSNMPIIMAEVNAIKELNQKLEAQQKQIEDLNIRIKKLGG